MQHSRDIMFEVLLNPSGMFKNHLKIAFRSLLRNKGLGALNIAGLAIGMTAAVFIFLWAENEMHFDSYHKNSPNIFRLTTYTTDKKWIWEGSPMRLAGLVQKRVPEVSQISRLYADNEPLVRVKNDLQSLKHTAYVDSNWFSLFTYRFIEGSDAGFSLHPYSVILSVTEARRFFGAKSAVGQTLQLDNHDYAVLGVVNDAPTNSSFQYGAFIPIPALLTNPERLENGESWDNTDYLTFIRIPSGASAGTVAAKLTKVLQAGAGDKENSIAAGLVPLADMHFEDNLQASEFEHGNRTAVYIMSALGALLLLVACINYVNLTTAKASLRSKEVSIRKIIGAARAQLFNQFVLESLMVSLLSLGVSLLLIYSLMPAFNDLTGKNFVLDLTSPALWKVTGSTLFASFVLNSIYPALVLSSFKPLQVFRGITILKMKDASFRKGLVIIQFAISIVLIAGTMVIYRQMNFIRSRDLGFDRSKVLSVSVPFNQTFADKGSFMQTMRQQLLTQSPIESVSMANQPIVRISSATTGGDWEGRDSTMSPKLAQLSADPTLAATMHFKMASGRWFYPDGQSDANNVILNETAVRELGIHQPVLGQRFSIHNRKGQIIGVVKDFHFKSMHDKIGPLVVFSNPEWWNYFMVRTRSGNTMAAVKAVEKTWKTYAPNIPFEYSFLDEGFDNLYRQERLSSQLILIFAVIAVIISALGLFGLAAFAAGQRTREVGIRKILGASVLSIGRLLSRDFVKLVVIAFLIATPVAWWSMNSWLQHFAYRTEVSWWLIALAGVAAIIITLIITNYHAVKVARTNPAKSLRRE